MTGSLLLATMLLLTGAASRHALGDPPPKRWQSGAPAPAPADPLSLPAQKWGADAATNELKIVEYNGAFLRYRMHIRDAKGDQVRDVIESRDGTVARLILKDGQPLTPQQDSDEHGRMQAMIDSPATFSKHIKGELSGRKSGAELIKLLPDAMLYEYVPGQPQRPSRVAHADDPPEIVIDYKPNPNWSPPTMEAGALTGIEGRVWIDPRTHFMMGMEGHIFRAVNIGWGLFAHIYPGGELNIEQRQVTAQRWLFTHFKQQITLRVVIKTIKEESDVVASDFTEVPAMTYQEAIHVLWDTPLPSH